MGSRVMTSVGQIKPRYVRLARLRNQSKLDQCEELRAFQEAGWNYCRQVERGWTCGAPAPFGVGDQARCEHHRSAT